MQKVTVVTDGSAEITKEQAVESLGSAASRFVVVQWTKEGESAAPAEEKKEMKSNLLAESQEWTNKEGVKITAAVQKVENGKVFFLMDGKVIPYEVGKLSDDTVTKLRAIVAEKNKDQ